MKIRISHLFFLSLIIHTIITSKENDDKITQLRIGNLALPGSQQPGPLLGFGQNIIDKGDFQGFIFPDILLGPHKNFTSISPSILYAPRDNFSIFIELPIAAHFKQNKQSSSGVQDLIVQIESVLYQDEKITSTNQITLVTALFLPTGNGNKNPPTGFGSPSFFIGLTASHLATEWYCYTSYAALLTTKHNNNKYGNQFFYQAGFGKNTAYVSERWLFTWMIELSGTYTQKRKINNFTPPNFGGNVILLGPSLWFSTQHFIAQAGIAPVISQHLFKYQPKNSVYIAFNFGWKFN